MNIHILIEEPEVPGVQITFDTSGENAKLIKLLPLMENLMSFLDHQNKQSEKRFKKEHIFFSNFTPAKQTEMLKEFRETFTLWDLDNPPAAPPMSIIHSNKK